MYYKKYKRKINLKKNFIYESVFKKYKHKKWYNLDCRQIWKNLNCLRQELTKNPNNHFAGGYYFNL